MKVMQLFHDAVLPHKAHAGDLGYDLFSLGVTTIYPGQTKLVGTGICIQFPPGYGALIRDRSSVATKKQLFTVAGVIDNGYTGEIKIAFYNASESIHRIEHGEKIAQLVLIPTTDFSIEVVSSLESSDGRGGHGFGSTGT
jgi:dUTP pyrophosphatase